MLFRRKDRTSDTGTTAVAEPPNALSALSADELFSQIDALNDSNREKHSVETERRLVQLRNLAGIQLIEAAESGVEFATPDESRLPSRSNGLPEFARDDVTPGLLRAGILRDGCVLVRGLIPRETAISFAEQIDQSFAERELHDEGKRHDESFYSEFTPDPRYGSEMARPWVKQGGGVLAADAPMPSFNMFEMFRSAGLPELVRGYLAEPPLIACQKTTLRKAEPQVPGAWHQDGKFMGPVRALNLWLSLSRCGDESPGLDIVPRRLDYLVTVNTEEAMLDYMISQQKAEEAAGDTEIIRPIFEPGDALLFDEMFLHKTGSDPSMPKPRFAIESWFFGPSAFAGEYAPLAVS